MKRKNIYPLLLAALVFVGLTGLRQTASAQREWMHKKLYVGVMAGPDFLGQLGVLPAYFKNAQSGMGYNFGAEGVYRFHDRFSVSLGFRYTRLIDKASDVIKLTNNGGYYSGQTDLSLEANFIEVPIRARYYFFYSRFVGAYLSLGVSPGMMLGSKTGTYLEELGVPQPFTNPAPSSPLTVNALGGIGVEVLVSHRFALTLMPEYRYYFMSPFHNHNKTLWMNALGIQAGVYVGIF